MMVSPEWYYKEYLAGKEPKEILKRIKIIRNEIKRLKEIEENPTEENFGERIMDPSTEVRIKCNRLYLQRAISALEELGVKYISSSEEKKATKFNENIENIIQFSLNIGGYFIGFRTYTIDINDSKSILTIEHFKNIKEYPINKNIFLRDLKDVYMGEWKKSYFPEEFIEDGYQWQISIRYKNGKFLDYDGDNRFPYNFDDLLECIREWLPDEEANRLHKYIF